MVSCHILTGSPVLSYMERQLTLVTGGTGSLGRAVVRELIAAGRPVRVMSRRERPEGDLPYEWATADIRRNIDAAVSGATTIIHCATTLGKNDVAATENLVAAAQRHECPHLIYISIVGIDRIPLGYYRTKLQCERVIEKSGIPYTIIRATQFHDLVVKTFGILMRAPIMVVPADMSVQPIDVSDVARRLVELAAGEPAGRVPDIGGPQVLSVLDLARTYLAASGKRRRVLPVRLPGRVFRHFRAGHHLTPDHAVDGVTFEQFLEKR